MPIKALVGGAAVIVALVAGTSAGPPSREGKSRTAPSRGVVYEAGTNAAAKPSVRCDRVASPSGSKRGKGTWTDPVRGPYRLIKLLKTGETGCLRKGSYHQEESTVRRERVTLQSAPGERAVWHGRVVLRGRGDRLLGLTLDGSTGPRCPANRCGRLPSPTVNAANVVIAGNDISSRRSGICVALREWGPQRPDAVQILDNRVHDCGRLPPTDHDHGIYVASGYHTQIRDNVVYDNADRGIQLYPEAKFALVSHNTVDGNGSGVILSERSAQNQVTDNVFTNSVVRWNAETYRLTGVGNRFDGNCVKAGNRNPGYNQNGGVSLPPLVEQSGTVIARSQVYAGRTSGNYAILPLSGCAGKGAPATVAARP